MATASLGSKNHRNRKNSGSAEFFKKQRRERNLERPKQVYNTLTKVWSR